jgi:hypothetical protein
MHRSAFSFLSQAMLESGLLIDSIKEHPDQGISQRDLCDRFGISPANIGARAKRKNLNTVAFLEQ